MGLSSNGGLRSPVARKIGQCSIRVGEQRFSRAYLQNAAAANRIVPFYQPKVCLSSGRVVGFEAVARWRQPEGEALAPQQFDALFKKPETTRMMCSAIVHQVAGDLRVWLAARLDFGRVAINLYEADFVEFGFAEAILETFASAGVPVSNLDVEVRECVRFGAGAILVLDQFCEAGVRIALDDFGTGHAELTHLQRIPVHQIKIEQRFVRRLKYDTDSAILRAMIDLGKALKKTVVAEGVETPRQADWLRRAGCHAGQGHLLGVPMPAADVPEYLDLQARRLFRSCGSDPLLRPQGANS